MDSVDGMDEMDTVDGAGSALRPRHPLCPHRPPAGAGGRAPRRAGFSLIEVMIATILVGLAIAALVAANSSFSLANDAGTDLSTAEFLAEQIRELTTMLPVSEPSSTAWDHFGPEGVETVASYDDLDDFDGTTYSPPINANRETLNAFAKFSQVITVQNVNRSNFDQVVDDRTSSFVRVTVRVLQNDREVCSASWIRARY